MTKRKKTNIGFIFILLVGFFAFNFVFPGPINSVIEKANPTIDKVPLLGKLPLFPSKGFKLGLDLLGGSHLVYQTDLSNILPEERVEAVNGLRDVIERRVNLFGIGEPIVAISETADSDSRLIIELPGIKDINQAIEMIGEKPYLEFKEERDEAETEQIVAKQQELQDILSGEAYKDAPQGAIDQKIAEYEEWLIDPYFIETKLTGQYLKQATLQFNQTTFESEVAIEFDKEGADIFEVITEKNIGKRLAIYIDDVLISAPVVNDKISGGSAQITGQFSLEEARELARNLNAGALPVPIELISQTSIGPTLGKISLERSLKAAMLGFIGVCLFMLVFYRFSGFLAVVSLILYAGIMLSLFKLIPVTLTLAGIGGAILSVGMAVDANVLIFERMKEELRDGEPFDKAITNGFKRAWPSIRDGNFTTLLVAIIMFSFGSSFVKGFAFTLFLGILFSMFSSLFITRTFLKMFENTKLEKFKWLWN